MYHLDMDNVVTKSTLSVANQNCSYRIYHDLPMLLIKQVKERVDNHSFRSLQHMEDHLEIALNQIANEKDIIKALDNFS